MSERKNDHVLFVCEKYFLRFYRPLADRLAASGWRPVWVPLDGLDHWQYEYIDLNSSIERLVEAPDLTCRDGIEALCALEHRVFERPDLFKRSYPYTTNVVRTIERARRLAEMWYRATLAMLVRLKPTAVFVWNGRYLPYSAVSAACEAAGQLLLTSEIGWLPGTIFLDRGPLSATTTDLRGRTFESIAVSEAVRAEAFLDDYAARKATMIAQTASSSSDVRQRLLGDAGTFLLLYGCQVDWDTNVVIGARRFRSNEAAVSFLMESLRMVPGGRIAVKTHPLDSEKREDRLREIVGDRGTVISDVHPHTLIEAADCVAVRNSTLGFEALCYRKPVLLLEDSKYKHPMLALEAGDVEQLAANLSSVARAECTVPDRETLQKFIVHLIDRYLMPVQYRYFFEPQTLDILAHFGRNESHQALEQMLREVVPPTVIDVDGTMLRAIEACQLSTVQKTSFLSRQVRRVSDWLG